MKEFSIGIVFGILLGIALMYSIEVRKEEKSTTVLTPVSDITDQAAKTIDILRDSVLMVLTQKGEVEIELNKAEAKLNEHLDNYQVAKVKRDTVKAIVNCDSIYNTLRSDYSDRFIQAPKDSFKYETGYINDVIKYRALFNDQVRLIKSASMQVDSLKAGADKLKVENLALKEDKDNLKSKVRSRTKFAVISTAALAALVAGLIIIK